LDFVVVLAFSIRTLVGQIRFDVRVEMRLRLMMPLSGLERSETMNYEL
jgi:hypothetical protein